MPSKTPLFTKQSAWILAVLLLAFAATLHFMGRIAWGNGGFGLWTWNAWSSNTSQLFGDPYSFSHILHGIIFFGFLWLVARKLSVPQRLTIAVLIEMAWEILENSPIIINRYRAATASLDYFGDSILNSVGDVTFMVIGFWIASRLPWKWTLALCIAIELIMLATMKDNLTLNIVMLLYPITAIKEWQMN